MATKTASRPHGFLRTGTVERKALYETYNTIMGIFVFTSSGGGLLAVSSSGTVGLWNSSIFVPIADYKVSMGS